MKRKLAPKADAVGLKVGLGTNSERTSCETEGSRKKPLAGKSKTRIKVKTNTKVKFVARLWMYHAALYRFVAFEIVVLL